MSYKFSQVPKSKYIQAANYICKVFLVTFHFTSLGGTQPFEIMRSVKSVLVSRRRVCSLHKWRRATKASGTESPSCILDGICAERRRSSYTSLNLVVPGRTVALPTLPSAFVSVFSLFSATLVSFAFSTRMDHSTLFSLRMSTFLAVLA